MRTFLCRSYILRNILSLAVVPPGLRCIPCRSSCSLSTARWRMRLFLCTSCILRNILSFAVVPPGFRCTPCRFSCSLLTAKWRTRLFLCTSYTLRNILSSAVVLSGLRCILCRSSRQPQLRAEQLRMRSDLSLHRTSYRIMSHGPCATAATVPALWP